MNTITRTEMRAKTSKDRLSKLVSCYSDINKRSIYCVEGQIRMCYNNKVDNTSGCVNKTRRSMNTIRTTIKEIDSFKSMVK